MAVLRQRLVITGAFLAGMAAMGVAAAPHTSTTAGAIASTSAASVAANTAANTAPTPPLTTLSPFGGRGMRGGFGGFGGGFNGGIGMRGDTGHRHGIGMRGGLTVSGVSGNTITASVAGQTISVTVSATTVYTEAGVPVTLAAVTPGSSIALQGTRTGTLTLSATAVEILLPHLNGVVTQVSGSSLTVTADNGAVETVTTSSSTHYRKLGAAAAFSAIAVGSAVNVQGTQQNDGSIAAFAISLDVPAVIGQVSAQSAGSYTVSGPYGHSVTITTSGSTVYLTPSGATTTASTITTGTVLMAQGPLTGSTLAATRIVVVPANSLGMGFGHGDGGMRGGDMMGGGPQGGSAIAPSTTSALPSF